MNKCRHNFIAAWCLINMNFFLIFLDISARIQGQCLIQIDITSFFIQLYSSPCAFWQISKFPSPFV